MSRTDEPITTAPHDWVAFARELAEAGWWADAVTAYEQALTGLRGARAAAPPAAGGPAVPAAGWQIRLLGGFTVTGPGGVVDVAVLRPQHRELLQVLCVFAERVVSDRQLCGWFWPDADPDRARHRLAVGISALRALPGPPVERVPGGYRLRLADGDTDLRRFERLLATARSATGESRTVRLAAAFAAWSGPLLPAVGVGEWADAERDRLRAAAVGAAAELADRYARDGRHREVVRTARAALCIDRHADRLWRRLVTALTVLGEPAAAATARREYTDVLVDLGVVTMASVPPPRRASA